MMKMNNPSRRSSFATLALALWLSALPAQSISAQRERQTTPTQNPAVTQPTPSPNPSPVATPSALSTVVQTKTATSTKSLAELRNRISEIIEKPELASAMVGIKVSSLDTGRVLFEENAMKLLRPASNMKIYTVATALDRLSPDYRFTTSVYAPTKPDSSGVIKGNLTIFGRGDPSIAARFNNGDYFKGIDDLATRIAAAGVKRVDGDLVGDESYFVGPQYGSG